LKAISALVNLILLHSPELDQSSRAHLSGARAAHLVNVLQVTTGQAVRIGLLDGPCGVGTVTAMEEGVVTLQCVFEPAVPPRPGVDLLIALPRPKVMHRLWAQLAALGVGRIILTNAERVERNYFDTHVLHDSVYRPLLIEGLQQARDTHLPLVSIHRRLKVLVEDELDSLTDAGLRLVAHAGATVPVAAAAGHHNGRRLLLAIGPEGGWNQFELALLEGHGFGQVSMGARTLRADTACIALLALAHAAMSPEPDGGARR
jgi:RsmE family RNA methyltransferase